MGRQSYSDESNRKHESHAEHIEKDSFGKGNTTRNWEKKLSSPAEEEQEEDLAKPDDVKDSEESESKH